MMRRALTALAGLVALTGCTSGTVWVSDRAVVPSTYAPAEGAVPRHVGQLRRLALLAVDFDYERQGPVSEIFSEGPNEPEATTERRIGDTLARRSIRFLTDWRGYEVVDARAARPAAHTSDRVETLVGWLAGSEAGSEPPPEVAEAATALARLFEVDGLIVVRGWGRPTSDAELLAVFGTFTLAWPILFANEKLRLGADIVDGTSGRAVWRRTLSSASDSSALLLSDGPGLTGQSLVEALYEPLEPALPAVFVAP